LRYLLSASSERKRSLADSWLFLKIKTGRNTLVHGTWGTPVQVN
jgi:hypothetical protein